MIFGYTKVRAYLALYYVWTAFTCNLETRDVV